MVKKGPRKLSSIEAKLTGDFRRIFALCGVAEGEAVVVYRKRSPGT